jgi:acetyltransferase-like isoleucine patch superfamily enzyme
VDDPSLFRTASRYVQRSRYLNENAWPGTRLRVKWEFLRRDSYITAPFYGPILAALREGRLEVGRNVMLLGGCWITVPEGGRARIGAGTHMNLGVFLAAYQHVEIGAHCMFANGCFITDADHRFGDPHRPIGAQGYEIKGPTVIGENSWLGVNVAVLGGVTIGRNCVIGANSVVNRDIEPFCVAGGVPARVIKRIDPDGAQQMGQAL